MDVQYLLIGGDSDPVPPEGESQEVRWFELDEARSIADPSMAEMFESIARIDLAPYIR